METTQFFDLRNGNYFCCEPGGRWHGWLFYKHPDGQFVSVMKTEAVKPSMKLHFTNDWLKAKIEQDGDDAP